MCDAHILPVPQAKPTLTPAKNMTVTMTAAVSAIDHTSFEAHIARPENLRRLARAMRSIMTREAPMPTIRLSAEEWKTRFDAALKKAREAGTDYSGATARAAAIDEMKALGLTEGDTLYWLNGRK
jgi:hypothetical protein